MTDLNLRRLAAMLDKLRRDVQALQTAPQLASSSVDVPDGKGGSVSVTVPQIVERADDAQRAAEEAAEKTAAIEVVLSEARAEIDAAMVALDERLDTNDEALADLTGTTIPGLQKTLTTLAGTTIPALDAALATLGTDQDALKATLTTLTGTTIPGLQASLTTLAGTTIPALDAALATLGTDQDALKATLTTLTGTTIPGLQASLTTLAGTTIPALQAQVTTLKDATIPALQGRLATAETAIATTLPQATADARAAADLAARLMAVSTAAPVVADGAGRPVGALWYRINASNAQIAAWRWTGTAWVAQTLDPTVIPNLSAAKITSGTIATSLLNASEVAAAVATFLQLNANQITAGTIDTARLNASAVAAAVGTFLKLSADQITSGTIDTARLNASAVAAAVGTFLSLSATQITTGTLATARLDAKSVAAAVATFLQLNANQITAGTIDTARLNASAVAAAVGTFLSLRADQITAVGAGFSSAVITDLWTKKIAAQKILANEVLIGGANLLADPDFTQTPSGWTTSYAASEWSIVSITDAPNGLTKKVARFTPVQNDRAVANIAFPNATGAAATSVAAGDAFRVRMRCRLVSGTVGQLRIRLGLREDGIGNQWPTATPNLNAATATPGAWVWLEGSYTVPATVGRFMTVTIHSTNCAGATTFEIDQVVMTRMTDASLIVDGAVKARHLESELVLTNTVIAGDPAGTHAQLDPSGMRVFKADPTDGVPDEVVRLGVAGSNDYFAIANGSGDVLAAIDENGVASVTAVSSRNDVTVNGAVLLGDLATFEAPYAAPPTPTTNPGWLDRLPRGVVASGFGQITVPTQVVSRMGIAELSYKESPGRNYKFTLGGMHVYSTVATDRILISLRYTVGSGADNAPAPTINSPILATAFVLPGVANGAVTSPPIVAFGRLAPESSPSIHQVRVLVCIERYSGTGLVGFNTYAGNGQYGNSFRFFIEDAGPNVAETLVLNSGGGTYADTTPPPPPTPPAKQTYTKEWSWTGRTNYVGGNQLSATHSMNTGTRRAYQGQVPGGGLSSSYIDFDDAAIRAALSGAKVNWVEVYLYFAHWYNNAGGTARIGLRADASAPTTYLPANGYDAESAGWPKPGGRWVRLPNPDGWRTGAARGIGLTPAGSTSYQYYGYVTDAKIRINYTK